MISHVHREEPHEDEVQLEDNVVAHPLSLQRHRGCCFRLARRACPNIYNFLRMVGYDQAFILKGWTHAALWISCLISFVFSCLWFADVFTLKCVGTETKIIHWRSWGRCAADFVGLLIFSASFIDSVRMIAHFDDDRQQVLQQKWIVLKKLNAETQAAIREARENVKTLRKKVTKAIQAHLDDYVANTFCNILPALEATAKHGTNRGNTEVELARCLRGNLLELERISAASLKVLSHDHEDAYKFVRHQDSFGESISDPPMHVWDQWINSKFPRFHEESPIITTSSSNFDFEGPPASLSEADLESVHSEPRNEVNDQRVSSLLSKPKLTSNDQEQLAKRIAADVLETAKDVLRLPDKFAVQKNKVVKRTNKLRKIERQRFGCGRPPAKSSGFSCCCFSFCCARMLAPLTCYFCCLPRTCSKQVVRRLVSYDPPKQIRIGCFWIQIFTKLQERLMQSIFFSSLYLLGNAYLTYLTVEQDPLLNTSCSHDVLTSYGITRACILDLIQKFTGCFAMVCFIPSMCFCLYHVRRLDSVMETIDTIHELSELHAAVRDFSFQMDDEAGSVSLLKAFERRVLCRLQLVQKFDKLFTNERSSPAEIHSLARDLLGCHREIEKELGVASEWFLLSEEEQKRHYDLAHQHVDAVLAMNSGRFRRTSSVHVSRHVSQDHTTGGQPSQRDGVLREDSVRYDTFTVESQHSSFESEPSSALLMRTDTF